MTFEERLASIDATLKALLQIQQTAAAARAEMSTAAPAAEKAPKTRKAAESKAAPAADAAGAAQEDSIYWVIEKHNTVYEQRPGEPAPAIEGAEQVTADVYQQKKDEFAKKINAAATQPSPAAAEPSATATPAAAATNTTSDVSFKTVVERLTVLSKDTRPGRGREGVLAILNKYLPNLPEAERKVPKLEALKQNAEILAAVEAALTDTPVEDDIFN